MSDQPKKPISEFVYYHALSHHVAHWAAYVAMIVAQVSLSALLGAAHGPFGFVAGVGTLWAIIVATIGALYFIGGMETYGSVLGEAVPKAYLLRTQSQRHDRTISGGRLAAVLTGLFNVGLLAYLFWAQSK